MIRHSLLQLVLALVWTVGGVQANATIQWKNIHSPMAERLEQSNAVAVWVQKGADTTEATPFELFVLWSPELQKSDLKTRFNVGQLKKPGLRQIIFLQGAPDATDIVDVQPDPHGELQSYVKSTVGFDCGARPQKCLREFSQYLEHRNGWIAADAVQKLSLLPFDIIESNRQFLPAANLRKWVRNRKIDIARRDFYSFLLGIRKHYADRALLTYMVDEFLSNRDHHATSMVGVLAGYGLSGSGYAKPMMMKTLRHRSADPTHAHDVLRALEFLHDNASGKVKAWLPEVLRTAISRNKQTQVAAIDLAARWGDPSVANLLPKLYNTSKSRPEVKSAIEGYCTIVETEHCSEIVAASTPLVPTPPPAVESSELNESAQEATGEQAD